MSENRPHGDDGSRRDLPLKLTDAEGREVWVVHSAVHSQADPEPDLAFVLAELPALLRRHWALVATAILVTAALGGLYLATAVPAYGVAAEILVERRDSPLDEFSWVSSNNAFLATQAEIIHSPTIAEPALEGLEERLFGPPDADEPFDPLNEALSLLTVTPVRGTDVMAIHFRAPDAEAGAAFVQNLISEYRTFLHGIEFSAHREALALLEQREAELRGDLDALRNRYRASLEDHGSVGGDGSMRVLQDSVLEFHARSAAEAATRRSTLQAQLAALRHAADNGVGAVPSGAVDKVLLEQLQEVRAQRSQLMANFGPKHPDLRVIESEISLLEEQVMASIGSEIARLENAIATDRAEERRLTGVLDRELAKSSVSEIERFGQEGLLGEIAQLTEIHDRTFRMLNEKKLTVGALDQAGVIVRVLTRPSDRPEKVWPRVELVMLPCLLIGAVGGLGLALFADRRAADSLPASSVGSLPVPRERPVRDSRLARSEAASPR